MRRLARNALALSILFLAPLGAAPRIGVQQLTEMLASARASQRPDDETASKIAHTDLKERLTQTPLASLSRDAGPRTRQALQMLADRSAFLDPPASEISSGGALGKAEQQEVLARAAAYTLAYVRVLPNLICTRVIRRYDDVPASFDGWVGNSGEEFHLRDTVAGELTLRDGAESFKISTANGARYDLKDAMYGLTTTGEFGSVLATLFASQNKKISWRRWEMFHGRRVAVFAYSVPLADSRFTVSRSGWRRWAGAPVVPNLKVAYRGELFIEPASGAIFRITTMALLPAQYSIQRSDTAVEYRATNLGGKSWLCPARSVTLMDEEYTPLEFAGSAHIVRRTHYLNQVDFANYRKFEAESTLVFAGDRPDAATAPAAEAAPPVETAAAPPPAATPTAASAPPEAVAPQVAAAAPAQAPTQPPPSAPPAAAAPVQAPPPLPPAAAQPKPAAESEPPVDSQAIFRVRLNVITVRAVIRDERGRAVGNLRPEDFELFDKGKRQQISGFAVESRAAEEAERPPAFPSGAAATVAPVSALETAPDQYVLYLFDDLNLGFADLSRTRTSAARALKDVAGRGARVAVFTTSGKSFLDFTSDWTKVEEALNRIAPQSVRGGPVQQCPDVSHHLADQVVNNNNPGALQLVIDEAKACRRIYKLPFGMPEPESKKRADEQTARGIANQSLVEHDAQTLTALAALKGAVRGLSVMPGQRSIVLVSPGFLTPSARANLDNVVDTAARNGVAINALDARGVYTPSGSDVEDRLSEDTATESRNLVKARFDRTAQAASAGVLADLADGTGGVFIQGSNDYASGFRRLAAAPEFTYVLAFTPPNLKLDGSFHTLKVAVRKAQGLTVRARRGYFAPKEQVDAAEQAKEEIQNAVFSRSETRDIPMTVRAQAAGKPAKVSVAVQIGLGSIRFSQRDGHNRAALPIVMTLFDANGRYVSGQQGTVDLDYPDDKLPAARAAGAKMTSEFDAAPGKYLVRVVLRDGEGHMSSTSRLVEAP